MDIPSFDDVRRASELLSGVAHRTPVLTSRLFDRFTGATLFFKCENFQRAGAFKFRGAWHAVSRLVEPSAAVPLAVVPDHPELFRGKQVAIILSGGNLDPDRSYT